MKVKSLIIGAAVIFCMAASAEVILSDNQIKPKDAGTPVLSKKAPQKKTGATYKWTIVSDKQMVKTDASGTPDMIDGVALHGNADANSTFTHGKCSAEVVFDLKNEYPISRVEVFTRKQTDHKYFNISKVKVYTSNDGKNFEYAGAVSGKEAVLVKKIAKSQLWKYELKLENIKARYVKIRADKKAKDGLQMVLCEMVVYGNAQ